MRILEAEEFPDIERKNHHGTVTQDLAMGNVHFATASVEATRDYYDWAQSVLHEARFRNARLLRVHPRKRVWRLHAEGRSNAEIGRIVGFSRWTIEDLVKKIRAYLEKK